MRDQMQILETSIKASLNIVAAVNKTILIIFDSLSNIIR